MFDPEYTPVSLRLGERPATTFQIYRDRIPQPGDEFGTTRPGEERQRWQVVGGQYGLRLANGVEAVVSAVPCA